MDEQEYPIPEPVEESEFGDEEDEAEVADDWELEKELLEEGEELEESND